MDTAIGIVHTFDSERGASASHDGDRLVTAIAVYNLSEDGRKASLVGGGNGREVQTLSCQIPVSRLHLVTVDPQGIARLKLRPRYQLSDDQQIVRIDRPPVYDAPPSLDDLLREAARNHQLERAYVGERNATRTKRREAGREFRQQVAERFLADRSQRALVHPAPTPTLCYVSAAHGRVRFDAATDDGVARQVPAEAHRRFRADLRAKADRRQHNRAAQLAIHEEKKRAVAEWVAVRGTADQHARQAAGVLPIAEVVECMTEDAFRVLSDQPPYVRDGAERLQAFLRRAPAYASATVALEDLVISVTDARAASAAQWEVMQEIQRRLPDATVTLRAHKLGWKRHPNAPTLEVFGIRVKHKVGPFTLVREYAAPG